MTHTEGRLAEAYTCSGSCATKITDEGFSYDQRGQMNGYYQSSPNSGGYYTLTASYWEDKNLKTVNGVGLSGLTYGGLDGEGRVTSVSANGTNLASNVIYNNGSYSNEPIGSLLQVTLGNGDTQHFTYDPNTRRMTQYSASVGAAPTVISGSLTWNTNGTLQSNNIVDGYNAADTQNCSYSYDDFIRAASVNCLNGSTKVWTQTFTYGSDAFGNLTKYSSGPGGSWMPGYNSANNQYALSGTSYDANGNLLADTFHTYAWLADGHVSTVVTGSTTASVTYDALENKVEENIGGVVHEYVAAFGVSAQMTGQTENATTVGLPGGVEALFSAGSLQRYRFPDWQGTIRAESNPATRTFSESLAFAPFGERYAVLGAPYNVDSFTGQPDQITSDEYDFAARELHNGQGRWISPDPMSGTGNKYVYADNNPLSNVDIGGLMAFGFGVGGGSSPGFLFAGLSMMDGLDGNEESLPSNPAFAPAAPQAPGADATNSGAQTQGNQQPGPAQQQKTDNLSNVVENETSSLKADPNAKPGQPGSAENLAAGQLAVAEVANRIIDAGHPDRVASSTLYDSEAAGLKKGDPAAVDAHNRSRTAAEAAVNGSNTTNGATQYRTRVGSNVTTPLGRSKTNPGTPVSMSFGPFIEGKHTVVIVVAP